MPYTPKTWENKPSTASPINATNLNHMEGGIKTNDDNIVDAQNAILTLQGEMLQAQGDISALETLVDSIFPVDTESGNPAVITDAFGGACKSLKLTLEPIQSGSGTPSPQNVRAISGRTQAEITRCGKNIIASVVSGVWLGATGEFTSNNNYSASNKIKVTPGATYTVSATVSGAVGTGNAILLYDVNGVYLGQNTGGIQFYSAFPYTFTVPANAYYCAIDINMTFSNFISAQLELGSTATAYEPYTGESITRTYGTTIYGGSDDVIGEGATSEWRSVDFDGSNDENWAKYGSGSASAFAMIISVPNGKADTIDDANVKCDKLTSLSTSASWGSYDGWVSLYTSQIVVGIQSITTVEDLRTWLSSNPLHVIYKRTTPVSVPLTAQNITLLHGDNVLTTDADSIEASYSADIALYIEKKIAEGSNNNRSVENSSLSKGGSSERTEEEKKEEEEIEEPKKEEAR